MRSLVEIKARFDEQANISWTRELSLVVRLVDHGLRRYVPIGADNYDASRARFYELGMLMYVPGCRG